MRIARARRSPGTCPRCSSRRCRCGAWSSTRSPDRRSTTRSRRPATSTPAWSTRRRRGASSTGCSAIPCLRCCGGRFRRVCRPGGCRARRCGSGAGAGGEARASGGAGHWDLQAAFPTDPAFGATLVALDGNRVATGKDFDSQGRVDRDDVVVVDETAARALVGALDGSTFTVSSVDEKPYRSSSKAPFITSTLQQGGGGKRGMTAGQVMRTAQGLYERGYITYMRTDSVTLSDEALDAARTQVRELYGDRFLPDAARHFRGKVKNAQEAHEAIRPAGGRWRTPDQLDGELRGADLRLYDLIWKRTLASQMADAVGKTVSVRIEAPLSPGLARNGETAAPLIGPLVGTAAARTITGWAASGRTITFPGYLRVYVEGSDDPEADLDDREHVLPDLVAGQRLPDPALEPVGHTTQPPARYTEASLVKKLEDLGIGRPSTYASIMQTIQDRGYVWKKGQALVPSWSAFAVVNLLESHFSAEVDYSFTARMENDLDEIAAGQRARVPFLQAFWFGNGTPGLTSLIDGAMANADPAVINAIPVGKDDDGTEVVVRNGKYGPYVKRGDDTASVPDDVAPDELTVARALELLAAPKGDEPIGTHPESGLPVFVKTGRYGPYVQLGDADTLPDGTKPKMSSLFKSMAPTTVTLEEAVRLLELPRTVGSDPATGEEIVALNGRYGPYVKKGDDSRSLASELLQARRDAGPSTRGRKKAAAKKTAKKSTATKSATKKATGKRATATKAATNTPARKATAGPTEG